MTNTTSNYDENKQKNEVVQVHCIECNRETRHMIIASYDHNTSEYDDSEGWSVEWKSSHQIIQCQGCMTSSFRQTNWFSEDVQLSDENDYGERITLYPKRSNKTIPVKEFWEVPNNLRRIYRESIDCFNNDSFTLTAAGLRAIVEGICTELSVNDGPKESTGADGSIEIRRINNLEGKILGLCERGYLTKKNAEIFHEHRYLGNNAVHELSQPSRDELELAINIIEHVFEEIFEIREKGEELKNKRIRRENKT